MAYGYRKVADSDICGVINHVSGGQEIREPFVLCGYAEIDSLRLSENCANQLIVRPERVNLTKVSTVSWNDISLIVERGYLPSHQYLNAVSLLRDEGFWKDWAVRALLAISVGHILSGIIFLFAFNWNGLPEMAKFALVGSGILACLIAWVLAKLDSPTGQAFAVGATVLVGVMFAVLGQAYQTPAMIHTPFVFWAILTLPFALASRNLAHWTVWLVILIVAITTYSNSGLRQSGYHLIANMLNIAVSGGLIVMLIVLDKILSPRLVWAHAEWFRILLVLAVIVFAFIGFTESFWDTGHGLWLLSLGLICGLLTYLYYLKPSLETLALAGFGLFTLVAQFAFKLLENADELIVGIFFLLFIWMSGLTLGLVKAFRHFATLPSLRLRIEALNVNDDGIRFVMSLPEFCGKTGLAESEISDVLASDVERSHPWYMQLFLAVAGVVTAVLGVGSFGGILWITMEIENLISFGILGGFVFGFSIFERRRTISLYAQNMLNTLIIVGGVLIAIGFRDKIDSFDAIIILLLLLSLIVLTLVRDRILEFLSAAAIISLISAELYYWNVPMLRSIILVIATVLGVILLTLPIGTRLYKAAGTAFMMAPALLGIALIHTQSLDGNAHFFIFSDDLLARIISLIVLLSCTIYLNKGKTIAAFNPPITALIPLLIGAAFVPLGGASALLLMLVGYIFGSQALAIIGTLLQIYFITMFYYDLGLDLVTKSIILCLSGLVFLGVWVFVRQKREVLA